MLSLDKLNKNIWREVSDSEELVSLLLEQNADHLRQATLDGTPFATASVKELFGILYMECQKQGKKFLQASTTLNISGSQRN